MKKSFLIAGLIACIGATNTYADIVISQADDNPDTTITVARAAKVGARANKKELQMAPDGGVVAINCPAGCSGDCYALNNLIICECKRSDGSSCDLSAEDVVLGNSPASR